MPHPPEPSPPAEPCARYRRRCLLAVQGAFPVLPGPCDFKALLPASVRCHRPPLPAPCARCSHGLPIPEASRSSSPCRAASRVVQRRRPLGGCAASAAVSAIDVRPIRRCATRGRGRPHCQEGGILCHRTPANRRSSDLRRRGSLQIPTLLPLLLSPGQASVARNPLQVPRRRGHHPALPKGRRGMLTSGLRVRTHHRDADIMPPDEPADDIYVKSKGRAAGLRGLTMRAPFSGVRSLPKPPLASDDRAVPSAVCDRRTSSSSC